MFDGLGFLMVLYEGLRRLLGMADEENETFSAARTTVAAVFAVGFLGLLATVLALCLWQFVANR